MKQTFKLPTHQNDKTKRVAYINARIIDPATDLDVKGGLLTIGNEIADFGAHIKTAPEGAEVIDCGGHVLCPGLLDIQVHFREPGQEYKETLASGSKSAAAGGVTTVVAMANTKPPIDDVSLVEFLQRRARETAFVRVHTYAAISKGLKGEEITEMGLLKEAGAVGFSDDGLPIMNSLLMRRALTYARELGVPIAQHAEDLHLSHGTCVNEGKVSAHLGLPGVPNAAEAIIVGRDIKLVELTGGRYHVLHISTTEALEEVRRAKEKGLNVTCEVAPHHFTLTDEAIGEYRTFAKMNPPLRAEKDREALVAALKDGTIDCIATDHAPHDQESKRVPMTSAAYGIVGLETMLPLSLGLYHQKIMSLKDVLGAMTYKAADVLNLPAGRLKKGAAADLVLMDIDQDWTMNPKTFLSKSQNSPFDTWPTKGRALMTVVGGDVVYKVTA